ncbi:hypothetical protein [Thermococcus sp. Bubb.Bath]|uniref:hypothetical protein n=1 Tax=Thermococcus sp. Bubb.Bath TaxID=1638242 RepID=UPI00143B4754|nr:hypothetical protein [Thermococcus sp. Bubb.Bath]NJF25590.1 hypothetical protein [Thermococcus sp. Bubb.Bath]
MKYRSLKCIRNTLILLSLALSIVPICRGFRNNDKTLAGLGLFALSFWLAWYDPITKDISKKTNSIPKTPGEVSTDLITTALLVLVILYAFLLSPSGKIFLVGLITLALLIIPLSHFYAKISRLMDRLSKKCQYLLPGIFTLTGIIALLIFRNPGGMATLLGFLASALMILEFERYSLQINGSDKNPVTKRW